jgi:hypothetical protein
MKRGGIHVKSFDFSSGVDEKGRPRQNPMICLNSPTWWLIPLSNLVMFPDISGLTPVLSHKTRDITYLGFVGASP